MPIPDMQIIMLPMLRMCGDGMPHHINELTAMLADELRLTDEERNRRVPSGQQTTIRNRCGWAKTHLVKAGLLSKLDDWGQMTITERGREILASDPGKITNKFLMQYDEFRNWFRRPRSETPTLIVEPDKKTPEEKTPEEMLEEGCLALRERLAGEILDRVKGMSPSFFEHLVVELLVAMGYGGSRRDAAETVGGSGDGGIDGIIKEDRLGLDVIYIQAKRWEKTVGRPDIQQFVGALQGKKARKGVFITTSDFTQDAVNYVSRIDLGVVLVDGEQLANLMIDFGIGVATAVTYDVKRVDVDYFAED